MATLYSLLGVNLIWKEKPKRRHVSKTKKELLLYRQNSKCAGCGLDFKATGVKPKLHHIGKSNRIDALQLLCPNCHDQAHTWKTRTHETILGSEKEKVLVKRRMGRAAGKKRRKKEKTWDDQVMDFVFGKKRKRGKRKSNEWSLI